MIDGLIPPGAAVSYPEPLELSEYAPREFVVGSLIHKKLANFFPRRVTLVRLLYNLHYIVFWTKKLLNCFICAESQNLYVLDVEHDSIFGQKIFNSFELVELVIKQLKPVNRAESDLIASHHPGFIPSCKNIKTYLTTHRIFYIARNPTRSIFSENKIYEMRPSLYRLISANEENFNNQFCLNNRGTPKEILKAFLRFVLSNKSTLVEPKNINIIICKGTNLKDIFLDDYIHIFFLLDYLLLHIRPIPNDRQTQTEN